MKCNGIKSRLGLVIKEWRSRIGISQEELAERSGLHRTYVSDVERGTRNLSLESISKLSIALEISLPKLLSPVDQGAARKTRPLLLPIDLVDILLVEDDPDDVKLTIHALKSVLVTNHIQIVRDGAEALDFLFGRGDYLQRQPGGLPQVILLDLYLPKISGLEVLRQVKTHPQTCSIPVVILTASSNSGDITASKRLGADGYIVKPVNLLSLSEVTPQLNLQWALLKSPPAITA